MKYITVYVIVSFTLNSLPRGQAGDRPRAVRVARQIQRCVRRVRGEAGGGVRAVQLPLPGDQVGGAGDEQAGPRGLQHRAGERGDAAGPVAEAAGGGTDRPDGPQVEKPKPDIEICFLEYL